MGRWRFRTLADQLPDPVAPLAGTDELDRTARQVRLPGGVPHRVAVMDTHVHLGRNYTTDCDLVLYGVEGAVLTTAEVGCSWCLGTAGGA